MHFGTIIDNKSIVLACLVDFLWSEPCIAVCKKQNNVAVITSYM